MRKLFSVSIILFFISVCYAQSTELKGFVYNKKSGESLGFVNLYLKETGQGTVSSEEGFYSLSKIPPGQYTLVADYLGFETLEMKIELRAGNILRRNLYLSQVDNTMEEFKVSARRNNQLNKVNISRVQITKKQLEKLPSVGGEADLIQYLQIVPGAVFSGDQGGQLYLRGGSPIMNKVLLDGMTIYNPFHSIGLFSVFDADIIKSADVYSAGFGAEYGGRISAIVDVKTRDGSKNESSGKLSFNPFGAKALLEGPIRKFEAGKGGSSYVLSYKNSYLDKSSPIIFPHLGENTLPYSFSDLFGKLSFSSGSGSTFKLFGFNFQDNVNFKETSFDWNASGLGANFLVLPAGSKVLVEGVAAYSNYKIQQEESDSKPRYSDIGNFNVGMNFSYFKNKDEIKYGFEINTFKTNFELFNENNRKIEQVENNTELNVFFNYRKFIGKRLIVEPGFRFQYYASLLNFSPEPRFRAKYIISKRLRAKFAGGLYSQNLISSVNDLDVVNLFYGFLSSPEGFSNAIKEDEKHKLQKAWHGVGGFELDLGKNSDLNVEGYIKEFGQLININRNKIYDDNGKNSGKPDVSKKDFVIENGRAFGFDLTYLFEKKRFYFWSVYSYNNVLRNDGITKYRPHFDRRHNINLVLSIYLDKGKTWEFNTRWNFGSGFPFTKTQGFFENITFQEGLGTDILRTNGELGIVYDEVNKGRLPDYHRLDLSLKKTLVNDEKNRKFVGSASVINIYDRRNIFYFDRISFERINQLPVLPSISLSYEF